MTKEEFIILNIKKQKKHGLYYTANEVSEPKLFKIDKEGNIIEQVGK